MSEWRSRVNTARRDAAGGVVRRHNDDVLQRRKRGAPNCIRPEAATCLQQILVRQLPDRPYSDCREKNKSRGRVHSSAAL